MIMLKDDERAIGDVSSSQGQNVCRWYAMLDEEKRASMNQHNDAGEQGTMYYR